MPKIPQHLQNSGTLGSIFGSKEPSIFDEQSKVQRDFPGGPVVKTLSSNAGGVGSIPGQGTKIPHASQPKNQNIKQKEYCNKLNKDFKNSSQPKKS